MQGESGGWNWYRDRELAMHVLFLRSDEVTV